MTKANDAKPSRPQRDGPTNRTNPTTGAFRVSDELWEVLAPLIPQQVNTHPLGGAGPEFPTAPAPTASATCCAPAVSGKPWMPPASVPATAHLRFPEWTAAGVFLELWRVGLKRFDELPGLDWSWLSMDGAITKSPLSGEKTGPNPTDRGQSGGLAVMRLRRLMPYSRCRG